MQKVGAEKKSLERTLFKHFFHPSSKTMNDTFFLKRLPQSSTSQYNLHVLLDKGLPIESSMRA